MSKVKNILFRVNLKGQGIVNYDNTDHQKYMYSGTKWYNRMGTQFNNISYAKKNFYSDENGDLSYKIKISSNCLRQSIFSGAIMAQSPNIVHSKGLLCGFIGSPTSMLRGYLFADAKESFKKTGAFKITDAEQTCGAVSMIETFSRSGEKTTDELTSDNTFFKKETVGEIKYKTIGNIDLMELQFLSCDGVFDRYAFNPDDFELFKMFMSKRLPNFEPVLSYHTVKSSVVGIPEYGFKFSNENVVFMVKEALSNILNMNITRNISYVMTDLLEYKLVYDPIVDTYVDDDNWVKVSTQADIDAINFDIEDFYVEETGEEAMKIKAEIEATVTAKKAAKKAIKKVADDAKKKKTTKAT